MAQTHVRLTCDGCQTVFFAEIDWWFRRLLDGLPALRCGACEARQKGSA